MALFYPWVLSFKGNFSLFARTFELCLINCTSFLHTFFFFLVRVLNLQFADACTILALRINSMGVCWRDLGVVLVPPFPHT